jgi:N-acetylglutamate synthase-like GNAT family acetyltransferase
MEIIYSSDIIPSPQQVIELYKNCGLPRPVDDADRIKRLYQGSNLIVTAWHNNQLVGVARCITDWAWSCYLADLAVSTILKKSGIGKKLIQLTQQKLGDEVMILLLSVPDAMEYYPKVGFDTVNNGFLIPRKK